MNCNGDLQGGYQGVTYRGDLQGWPTVVIYRGDLINLERTVSLTTSTRAPLSTSLQRTFLSTSLNSTTSQVIIYTSTHFTSNTATWSSRYIAGLHGGRVSTTLSTQITRQNQDILSLTLQSTCSPGLKLVRA